MKKLFLLWAVLAVAISTSAQNLPYDDYLCDSLYQLGVAPACPTTVFTNVGATNSDIGFDNAPSCFNGGLATRDVWFSFVCSDTLLDYRITLTGVDPTPIENPQFAIYRGDCTFDGFAELLCAKAEIGENSLFLDVEGLTPGLTYYIRVSDYSTTATPNWGDFTLCVDKIPPIVTIDQGSSTLCAGTLYDSGGPDNDYGPDENHTFVICPSQPSGCITFTLDYYNIEAGFSDVLSFYDGNSTSGAPLGQVGGFGFANWGGVCYSVQAASGCLTVQFESDNDLQFEGWQGHWQCSSEPCPPKDAISLNPDITQDSIADFIKTPFTTVNVTAVNCAPGSYATFSYPSETNDLQMGKGLLLTTGSAANAPGPSTKFSGVTNFGGGDADLDYLSIQSGNVFIAQDACIVEADVFAASDELSFEYVFGSEEYPEFVNTSFNDIFAFLISGPGIVGDPGLTNSAKNLATLPGTNTPVEINSVNYEQNWPYYRDYSLGQELTYDGLTSDSLGVKKSLTARTKVTPCNTYHLKFAIADRTDTNYDSGVFISKIQGGGPTLSVNFASGIDYFVESCTGLQDVLIIKLSEPKDVPTTYTISISGTAILGLDYLLGLPNTITFLPGQTELSFPITPIADNLTEGNETIVIAISSNFGCGSITFSTITVDLKDNVQVQVTGGDTLLVCAGGTLQLLAKGAQSYFWSPPGAVSNAFIANPTITPTQNIWLEVTGTVGTCTDNDSVYIMIINPQITANVAGGGEVTSICLGNSVQLQSTNNVGNAGLLWTPALGLSDKFNPNPIASPTLTTTYQVQVSIAGCVVTDQVTVNVDTLFFPDVIADTTVCQNYPVQLANVLNSTTTYSWSPATGLSDPASSGPIATPEQTTTYTLTTTSPNGVCSQTASVTVTVIQAAINIAGDEYREICLGDTVTLNALTQPAGTVSWSPSFYVSSPTGATVTSSPDESVTITATTLVNGCTVRDSVRIRVDSLPTSTIFLDPEKPIYCPGDTIYLLSKVYEPADFPDIKPEWISGGGDITPLDLWNLVIYATTTKVFTRKIENRGCSTKDSITVNVGTIPTIMITANPPQLCPGQSSQLTATVDPGNEKLEWKESTTLSDLNIPNPIATPTSTTTYTVTTPDADCPAEQSIQVEVLATPNLQLPVNPTVCLGSSIQLNNGPNEPGTTYTWTSEPPGFTSSLANPIITPTNSTTYKVTAQGALCTASGEVVVTVADATLEVGANQTICTGATVTLNATVVGTPGTVTWQPANQSGISIQVMPTTSTTYVATLNYGSGCSAIDSVQVFVLPIPTINLIGDTAFCLSSAPSIQLNTGNNEPGITYIWTSDPAGFTSSLTNPVVTPTVTTTYKLTAQGPQCSVSDQVTVTINSATLEVGADQTICFGDPVKLTATVTGTPGIVTWTPGNQTGLSIDVTPLADTTYTATLVYGGNPAVCIATDALKVFVSPKPTVEITGTPLPGDGLCLGTEITLKAINKTPPAAILTWLQGNEAIPADNKDSVKVVSSSENVTFKVVATLGTCTVEDAIEYTFKKCFDMPNAFTPNGDAVNGTFGPLFYGADTEVLSFTVYNRWGQKVFESTRDNVNWDGRKDGKDAPSDVYAYVIRVRFAGGVEDEKHGEVTLLR